MLAAAVAPTFAQQGTIRLTSATQIATGDPLRLGGQRLFEPDVGISMLRPEFRFGTLRIDVNTTRRDNRPAVGRAMFGLSDVKYRGLDWTIDAGDTTMLPMLSTLAFTNLFAPAVTVKGASVTGINKTTSISGAAGRVTVLRNIFGTDADALDQTLALLRVHRQATPRFAWSARGSYVRSGDLQEFTSYVRSSRDVGANAHYRSGRWDLVADAGFSTYRRPGAETDERQPSWLLGAIWAGERGWLQLNAQRFSIARLPVVNFPYSDRQGVFVTGERDLGPLRLFGGWEAVRNNLDPEAAERATVAIPEGTLTRGFGGARLRFGRRSFLSARVEGGDRAVRPSRFTTGFQSDNEVVTGEWQSMFSAWNAFVRYERRSSTDLTNTAGTFVQHDASAHFFYSLPGSAQVFLTALSTRRDDAEGGGLALWQAGGGAQMQIKGGTFARVEPSSARTLDRTTRLVTPRAALNAGMTAAIGRRTMLSADVFVDRTPVALAGVNPWLTRTMIRLTRTFATGSARPVGRTEPALDPRGGPSGTISGVVYLDWNGNGIQEPGEDPVSGVGILLGIATAIQTGDDGRFSFVGVPVGDQTVGLDLAALPATFDPPSSTSVTLPVSRGKPIEAAFGVLPLGLIRGRVYQDVNGDGQLGPEDQPVDEVVAVLDEGARSERAREGRFEFDGARPGMHQVELAVDSLPEGAQLTGDRTVVVELTRDRMTASVDFLIRLERRPEIRRVFPVKK